MKTRRTLLGYFLAPVLCLVAGLTLIAPSVAALSGSEFQSGRIIDDSVFFNGSAMNASDIQAFLNAKVPSCDTNGSQASTHAGYATRADWGRANGNPPPYTCLKDYSQDIPSKSADSYCSGGVSGGNKSAAQIIYDVAQACNVSPKVLIVLLQKEQSLVTDDWPWSIQYRSATGYGCPDSAPCDAEYYGFFNQVYNAARQFQRYAKLPTQFNYRSGAVGFVQYNPNAACGGGDIAMQNQATAGLYNYTPYQPNAAALNNLYGTGDSCSAYGNRNFWRMYIDWFGSPLSTTPYAWWFEGQETYSDAGRTRAFTSITTAAPGEKIYVRIKARNMGTETWNQSLVRVGTSRPTDRASAFVDSSWQSGARPGQLKESSLTPGQIGTFEFVLQAPTTVGTYHEYFNLVIDGVTWLNDIGLYYVINVVSPTTPTNTTNVSLNASNQLGVGEYLLSPDTHSVLILQSDGNLVFYSNYAPVWHSNTAGQPSNRLVMQGDGNLVLYSSNNQPLWQSNTAGTGAKLTTQTDGNLVIYNQSNTPLWQTATTHNPDNLAYVNTALPVTKLYPSQLLETADRRFKLVLQPDGNLVLYSPTRALWSSSTNGRSTSYLALQPDGNLVLYDSNAQPLWFSATHGHNANKLVIQQDGNLVLYDQQGSSHWSTFTAGAQ